MINSITAKIKASRPACLPEAAVKRAAIKGKNISRVSILGDYFKMRLKSNMAMMPKTIAKI